MSIVFHEDVLRTLLESSAGPVGRVVERRAEVIAEFARRNVDNPMGSALRPWVRTGDLRDFMNARGPFNDPRGFHYNVGSIASHGGVRYPSLIERGGIAPNGKPYRYPYLIPAVIAAGFVPGS